MRPLNRLTAKGNVQSETEPVKTEQNVMSPRQFFSSAFADFSLSLHWHVAPEVCLPQSVLPDFCSPVIAVLQSYFCHDWLFPTCPLFSEGRAKTKLKYLTISGFGGWLSAEVSAVFQWWMKKWNECWAEWLKKAPELSAVVGNVLTNIQNELIIYIVSTLLCLGIRWGTRTNRTCRKPRRHGKL